MSDTLGAETRFAIIPEWVLFASIPPLAVRLYAVLQRHADEKGRGAFPSRKRLADLLGGVHPTTIDRALGELVGIGAVSVEARYRQDGGRTSNAYTLRVLPPTQECAGGEAEPRMAPTRQSDTKNENPVNENHESLLPADADERVDDSQFESQLPVRLALSAALGIALDERMTDRERSQWDLAVRDLVKVGATADDVTARCEAFHRIWPSARLTPLALVKHWGLLGAEVVTAKPGGFEAWLETTARQFGRGGAHDVIDDMSQIDDQERARRHAAVDELYDRIERDDVAGRSAA